MPQSASIQAASEAAKPGTVAGGGQAAASRHAHHAPPVAAAQQGTSRVQGAIHMICKRHLPAAHVLSCTTCSAACLQHLDGDARGRQAFLVAMYRRLSTVQLCRATGSSAHGCSAAPRTCSPYRRQRRGSGGGGAGGGGATPTWTCRTRRATCVAGCLSCCAVLIAESYGQSDTELRSCFRSRTLFPTHRGCSACGG